MEGWDKLWRLETCFVHKVCKRINQFKVLIILLQEIFSIILNALRPGLIAAKYKKLFLTKILVLYN